MTTHVSENSSGGSPARSTDGGGIIGVFVRHPTAANLLMLTLVLLGLFGLQKMNTQFFPTIEVPSITVSVAWPGASAEDVEKNIIDALEPELRFLDDVEEVTGIAREGSAVISLQFEAGADMQKAQSDIEQAVARVSTLPEDSEDVEVTRSTFYESVGKVSVSGPFSEAALKSYAKTLRDGLLAAGIDRVTLKGSRPEEIEIRLNEAALRRLDLTPADVATRIRDNTRDLPSGLLEGAVEMQLRSLSDRRTPEELGGIEIRSFPDGQKVFLRDIAVIETRFDDDAKIGLKGGNLAIELNVQRSVAADTLKTMEAMERYIEEARARLPASLTVEVYDVRGKLVAQRLGILVTNGIQGLIVVLIVLFIFLDFRIAFWTAAGIPVAFLATLAAMYATGQTINMMSMFALIMMLGIIVDDAIVVGEHTATLSERGYSPLEAAHQGAVRMMVPVLAATLTTMAAFYPITLIQGRIGDIMFAIPLVVMAVLVASLIECFLILPGHMRHGGAAQRKPSWFRRNFDGGMDRFRKGPFRVLVEVAYGWRYATIAVMIGGLILAAGLLAGGRVKFTFFPSPESESVTAAIYFGAGTPREDQIAAIARIEEGLAKVERDLLSGRANGRNGARTGEGAARKDDAVPAPAAPPRSTPNGTAPAEQTTLQWLRSLVFGAPVVKRADSLIVSSLVTLGEAGRTQGENVASVEVELAPSEERTIRTRNFVQAWRRNLPNIPGVERIALNERRAGPPGRDLDIRLQNAPIETLKTAALELADVLASYPGVRGISDDLPYGRPELVLELTPRGTALGFTGQSVGSQVRNAFEGTIATRFARGDEEITVRVMRDQKAGGIAALTQLYLRSPSGEHVPITEVVTIRERQGFSIIQRRDGARTVAVTADVDTEQVNIDETVALLRRDVMPDLAARYALTYDFKGRDEERRESFADLRLGALLSLALIYIILAWVFESYARPLAVMAIIPFGLVGAIGGHYVMGMDLTIISMIGLLGLSGILVNDSIILVSQVNERLAEGQSLREASIGASQDRFRAVMLTSLTTIGGLAPLLFEESRQAQFLIPMAVTLVFGLAAATALVLLLVPALMGFGGDIARAFRWIKGLYFPERQAPPAPAE
ncbi:MAG: MMPL family transporter [Rhizobiales bacterium]|nr:MMPL family transporter [Hyphomicrobiales bacterium]